MDIKGTKTWRDDVRLTAVREELERNGGLLTSDQARNIIQNSPILTMDYAALEARAVAHYLTDTPEQCRRSKMIVMVAALMREEHPIVSMPEQYKEYTSVMLHARDPQGITRVWAEGPTDEEEEIIMTASEMLVSYLTTGKFSVSHLKYADFTWEWTLFEEDMR